ncbi:hypothetical protein Shyhy01_76270 [Streptomyces hygroscopicus subsp. hygroscopicus]|nr:hypothetical protein Shyhy01_76270 [Streptomyces hygroscopicus subsp. hygroscopicus]
MWSVGVWSAGVAVVVVFPLLTSVGRWSGRGFSGWCDRLAAVVGAEAGVAVVREDFDGGGVLEQVAVCSLRVAVASCV